MYGVDMNLFQMKKKIIHRVIKREEKIRGGGTDFNDLIQGKKEENVLKVICDVIFNQSIYQIKSINISNQSFHQSMCWKPSKNYSLVLSIFNVTKNKHFFVFKK